MLRDRLGNSVFLLLFLVSSVAFCSAQNEDIPFQFDPSIAVNLDINPKVRLEFLAGREDSDDLSRQTWKVKAGVSFRAKRLFAALMGDPDDDKQHLLVWKANYEYSSTDVSSGPDHEHRFTLEATPRYRLPGKFTASNRNRAEFRWISGQYSFRYRNRLKLERPVKIERFRFIPYGTAEAYWDQRFHRWNQFGFAGGAEFPINRRMSLDVYYARRHCLSCTSPHINLLSVTLNLFFKLKE
jgi:hypothetical protein